MADPLQPIIIKKVKKGGHGHHGGAWKVAYADFVTAMMAFFLLMWLLSATTEEQKRGLADYFSPSLSTTRTGGGGEGLLGGTSDGTTGVQNTSGSPLLPAVETKTTSKMAVDTDQQGESGFESTAGEKDGSKSDEEGFTQKEYKEEMARVKYEEDQFESIAGALKTAIEMVPELKGLSDNVKILITDEGLKIELIDQHNYSMFPSGKAEMNDKTKELIKMVARVIKALPHHLSITGHTDAHPFSSKEGYDNWDLSSDRANATRRFLKVLGIASERMRKVEGKADVDPYLKEDPYAPQNRRVSITLLRENKIPKKITK